MTTVLCNSLECRHNDGNHVCVKKTREDENVVTILVGPYWRCDDYEEVEGKNELPAT